MASQPPPPPKKKSTTTISALGDDLLCEIFLRLPSLPSLVRAALTCCASLRAVRSSPAFRRRFRELHPPPLLGLFLDIYDPSMPAFALIRRRSDPDHAAAVRGADVFLTRLPDDDDAAPEWSMIDCRNGYVVLVNRKTKQMAVYNPLTAALDLFPCPPDELSTEMFVYMLSSEEDHGSFRVVCILHEEWVAQAAVFSSDTREWQIFPLGADASQKVGDDQYRLQDDTLVNGFVYWTFVGGANVCVLNTATLQFSRIDLPPHMEGQEACKVGETKDGKLCMVCATELMLVVWVWRADDRGVDRWVLDKTFLLKDLTIDEYVDDYAELNIVAITGGFLYFSTFDETRPNFPCWFLSFCLETAELNKLCPILHSNGSYPYIMAWPPSLVCNKGCNLGCKEGSCAGFKKYKRQ